MGTISRSGIVNGGLITANHITNIIDALDGTSTSTTIIATGSFSGSFKGDGSGITGVTGEWDGTLNGNASITGSLIVTAGVTASLFGTASYVLQAVSSSYSTTSSFSQNAKNASDAVNATSSSYALSSSRADSIPLAGSGIGDVQFNNGGVLGASNRITISSNTLYITNGGILNATGSLYGTASWAESASNAFTASYALSAQAGGLDTQIQFNNNSTITGSDAFKFIYSSSSLQAGEGTIASGLYSHTEGINTQALGAYSHAEGGGCVAEGQYSHAEGSSTQAIGDHSHTEGSATYAGFDEINNNGSNILNGTASLASSAGDVTAIFNPTTFAIIRDSGTAGILTENTKLFEIASSSYNGTNTTLFFVEPINSSAPKWTVGHFDNLNLSDTYTFSKGGFGSNAKGVVSIALGDYSNASGRGTVAVGWYQTVCGQYNTLTDNTSPFIVGNGLDSENRADAFKVTHSSSIAIPQTQSAAPSWTGVDGEIIPATVSGKYYLYMWMNGAWRSSSFA